MTYQLKQLEINATDNIECPHCHQQVVDWDQEQYVQPCEHVLFIAMDLGFEYITDEFEKTMSRSVDDIHAHDDQLNVFDELVTNSYPKYLIYKSPLGAQDLSRYVGFTAE